MTAPTEWVAGHFIAGEVALDLANTVFRRWPELGSDLLNGTGALGTWLLRAGLVTAAGAEAVTDADLDAARVVRARLWEVFDAQRGDVQIPADALAAMLEIAHRTSGHVAVGADGSMAAADVPGALAVLALRALALILDPPPQGVRACDRCGWFFIDSSRGRRRRWCSMKTCGNQAKAARYRAGPS